MKEGWKTVELGGILTPEQLARMDQIYKETNGDLNLMIESCKQWFNEPAMARQMYSKDMVPSYAGYALPYYYLQAKKQKHKTKNNKTTKEK